MAKKHEITAMLDSFEAAVAKKHKKKQPMRTPWLATWRHARHL